MDSLSRVLAYPDAHGLTKTLSVQNSSVFSGVLLRATAATSNCLSVVYICAYCLTHSITQNVIMKLFKKQMLRSYPPHWVKKGFSCALTDSTTFSDVVKVNGRITNHERKVVCDPSVIQTHRLMLTAVVFRCVPSVWSADNRQGEALANYRFP